MKALTCALLVFMAESALSRPAKTDDEVLGPAEDAPVMADSRIIPVNELPMEHRRDVEGNIVLPDTMKIKDEVYEALGVDTFFSMWFVFLNNNVDISDEPFTILAPVNSSNTSPETLLKDEALAEEVLVNHIVLGEEVRPEKLLKAAEKTTVGGSKIKFKIDKEGELWANDAKIVGWTQVENGLIYAIDKYLFTKDSKVDKKKQEAEADKKAEMDNEITDAGKSKKAAKPTKKPTTTTTTTTTTEVPSTTPFVPPAHWVKKEKCRVMKDQGSRFKSIVVCEEVFVDPALEKDHKPTTKTTTARPETDTKTTTSSTTATTTTTTTTTALKPHQSRIDDAAELTLEDLIASAPALKNVKPYLSEEKISLQPVTVDEGASRDNSSERAGDEPVLPGFFRDIVDVLGVLRFGSETFVDYIQEMDFSQELREDTNYTAVVPFDEAFRRWTPVDHGFDPFDVRAFAREVVANHILVGAVDPAEVEAGAVFQTVGGKTVEIGRLEEDEDAITVNGVPLIKGGTPIPHGSLLFIDRLLFVDSAGVEALRKDHAHLETAPFVFEPFHSSQFLSHAYDRLEGREDASYVVGYLNRTEELGDYAKGNAGYSFFVPRDSAFWRLFVLDATAPDPFLEDREFRLQTLLGLLAKGRVSAADFDHEGGKVIQTLNNETITLKRDESGNLTIHDGRQKINVVEPASFVFNLGTIFVVDRVLHTQTSDVIAVMERFAGKEEEVRDDEDLILDDDDDNDDDKEEGEEQEVFDGEEIRMESIKPIADKGFVNVLSPIVREGQEGDKSEEKSTFDQQLLMDIAPLSFSEAQSKEQAGEMTTERPKFKIISLTRRTTPAMVTRTTVATSKSTTLAPTAKATTTKRPKYKIVSITRRAKPVTTTTTTTTSTTTTTTKSTTTPDIGILLPILKPIVSEDENSRGTIISLKPVRGSAEAVDPETTLISPLSPLAAGTKQEVREVRPKVGDLKDMDIILTKDELMRQIIPRKNRKDVSRETPPGGAASISFSDFEDPENLETKVMFINNKMISIIRQKQRVSSER